MPPTHTSDASASNDEISTPLWQFVTKVEKLGDNGGSLVFKCNFCNLTFRGSYSRVKAHLLKTSGHGIRICSDVTTEKLQEMQTLVDDAELHMKRSLKKEVSTLTSSGHFSPPLEQTGPLKTPLLRMEVYKRKKRKAKGESGDSPLEKLSSIQAQEQLDAEIARMFYSGGLPFNFAKNPYYMSSFAFAANNSFAGYTPPSYNSLKTKLLQKEKANVEMLLEPIKATWKEKGVSIVCDGWTNPQKLVINCMAVTDSGPMFLRAIRCEYESRDKYSISNLIKEVINEVGSVNVVQVITDNAPVCNAAGMLVEQCHPCIFWTPSVVDTLDLALKNICEVTDNEADKIITHEECGWITEVATDARMIKNFIMDHPLRLSMFNNFSKLKILAIADTRFASVIVMLKRFKMIRSSLHKMATSDQWNCYHEDDVEKAMHVQEKLLDDSWWDRIDYILTFTGPIYEMLRFADTDESSLHLVHEMWNSMITKVKVSIYKHENKSEMEESRFWSIVHSVLESGRSKSTTPLHCLAYSLNPRCSSKEWLSENPNCIPPQKDVHMSSMRRTCLKRLFPNNDERRQANEELAKFLAYMDDFSDHDSIQDRVEMDPKSWWIVYGASTPLIQHIAIRLLGQPSSSSCCERNWSTYSFVEAMTRNKIAPHFADDLMFVHTNLRLLSRKTREYGEGETKMWDIAGDAFETIDDVGTCEIASLSLDEPEFETVLFEEDDYIGEKNVVLDPNSRGLSKYL